MKLISYRRKVYYYETDALGIVHHSNFIRWLEEGRLSFFEQLGVYYHELDKQNMAIIICRVSCDYKKMFRFNDEFEIEVKVKALSPAKFSLEYEIRLGNQIYATAESTHCGIQNNKIINLKKTLPEIYELMLKIRER